MARPRKHPPKDIVDPRTKPLDHHCLTERMETARKARRWFERDWMLNLAYVQNEQYVEYAVETGHLVDRDVPKDQIRTKHNVMSKITRIERAKILRTEPKPIALPARDDTDDLMMARQLNAYFDQLMWEWTFPRILRRASWWTVVTGNAFLKWYWVNGVGAAVDVCSPFELFVDPYAKRFESARWAIHSRFYDEATAWDMYDGLDGVNFEALTRTNTQSVSGTEHRIFSAIGSGPDSVNLEGVLVNEYWEPPTPKKPDGAYIVFTPAGIVYEGPFPYEHGRMPFTQIGHVERASSMWYDTSLTGLRDLQDELNRTEAQIIENRVLANGKWYIPSGLELEHLPNAEARQILKGVPGGNPGLKPEVIEVQALPAWVGSEPSRYKDTMQDLAGQHEVSNAGVPGRVESGQAIQLLMENEDSVIKDTVHSRDEALSKGFWMTAALLKQYGDPEVLLRSWDDDGAIDIRTLKTADVNLDFHVRVQSTDALPNTVAGRFDRVINLVDHQILTPPEARELLDLTKADPSLDLDLVHRKRAWRENQIIKNGVPIDPKFVHNHDVHIAVHEHFMNTDEFDQLDEKTQLMFEYHIDMHKELRVKRLEEEAALAAVAQGASLPQPPGAEGAPAPGPEGAPAPPPADEQGPPPVTG